MKLKILLFFLCLIGWSANRAQAVKDAYISPGISLGYCLSSHGFTFGLDCDIGLLKTMYKEDQVNYGISISKYWINVNQGKQSFNHRMSTINFMMESRMFDFKFGYGRVKNPWGYGKVNLCSVSGLNIDLSYTQPNYSMPWLGFKSFFYNSADWRWLDKPYYIPYIKYKYDFRRSGLKE